MKFSDFVIVSILCSPEEIVLCFNYSSYQKQKKILKNVTSSSLDKNNKIKQRIPKTCINAVTFILHPLLKDCFSTVFFYLPSSKYCCMLLRNFSLFLPLFFFFKFYCSITLIFSMMLRAPHNCLSFHPRFLTQLTLQRNPD